MAVWTGSVDDMRARISSCLEVLRKLNKECLNTRAEANASRLADAVAECQRQLRLGRVLDTWEEREHAIRSVLRPLANGDTEAINKMRHDLGLPVDCAPEDLAYRAVMDPKAKELRRKLVEATGVLQSLQAGRLDHRFADHKTKARFQAVTQRQIDRLLEQVLRADPRFAWIGKPYRP
jgi:hypothetical protein